MAIDPHNWETDPRPLAACLKDWHGREGRSRRWAAAELRVSMATYNGWCAGRAPVEGPIRRLMTMITVTDELRRQEIEGFRAALRMIRETIEEHGPPGILPSEEAVLQLYGPEPVHEAEALCRAIERIIADRQ
jgi:hypothetical protein